MRADRVGVREHGVGGRVVVVHDDAYLARIAATVRTLARHGVLALLDFHQDLYNERFQGEGAPDSAVQDGGLANPKLGFPGNYLANPAVQHAFLEGELARADRFMVPWLEWAYCGCEDPTTTGPGTKQAILIDPSKPPRGSNLVRATLGALVYGGHYAVRVSGGAILSSRGASTLVVGACPGTRTISVSVAPSGRSRGSCPGLRLARPATRR